MYKYYFLVLLSSETGKNTQSILTTIKKAVPSLFNSLYLGLHSREVKRFSSDTFKDVYHILTCGLKVSRGIITLGYEYLYA